MFPDGRQIINNKPGNSHVVLVALGSHFSWPGIGGIRERYSIARGVYPDNNNTRCNGSSVGSAAHFKGEVIRD